MITMESQLETYAAKKKQKNVMKKKAIIAKKPDITSPFYNTRRIAILLVSYENNKANFMTVSIFVKTTETAKLNYYPSLKPRQHVDVEYYKNKGYNTIVDMSNVITYPKKK